jgi:membrane-bound lytic murein transglycosylase F
MASPLRTNVLFLLLLAGMLAACGQEGYLPPPVEHDLAAIQARDTLVVLTTYNSTSYFLYRGEAMGYEYELLRAFTEARDLTLKMRVVRDRDSLFSLLNRGEGDVVAARLVPRAYDSLRIAFTEALYETPPTLVQRNAPLTEADLPDTVEEHLVPDEAPLPDSVTIQARLVTKPAELADKTVHLPGRSAYYDRLVEIEDAITGDIEIVEAAGDVTLETLIRRVAQGEIAFTVSQENIAELTAGHYANLLVRPTMGPAQRVAWATRVNAPALLDTLSAWVEANRDGVLFRTLYRKYFVDRRGYQERVQSEYLASETGRLSPYDDLLAQYADSLGWDWRLLASQAYQESRFKPRARSWAGARGLLQLMPPTARQFGVRNPFDPEDNVRGAARFLAWLEDQWAKEIPDALERRKFVLASYNAGLGHVRDARRLAEKHGDDPDAWDEVAYWLLQKSKRPYYTDPVVKHGFCRGIEPVTYVDVILERFDHYRQMVEAEPALAQA